MGAATSKFDTPLTLSPNSARLAWWRCGSCSAEFRRRIIDHVCLSGRCPQCCAAPKAAAKSTGAGLRDGAVMDSSLSVAASAAMGPPSAARPIKTGSTTMAAHNPSAIRGHITDVPYFANTPLMRKMLQPMLAHAFEDRGHKVTFSNKAPGTPLEESEKVFVGPKIDGIRCLVARDPTSGIIYYCSRQGLLFDSCEHLDAPLHRLFDADPSAILDGELYYNGPTARNSGGMTFEELTSTVRTGKANRSAAMAETQRLVQYHAFDVAYSAQLSSSSSTSSSPSSSEGVMGCGEGFGVRFAHLSALIDACHAEGSAENAAASSCEGIRDARRLVRLVTSTLIYSIVEAFNARDAFIAAGFEGAMLRRGGAPYGHGKRSAHLLKLKRMHDREYRIVGAIEGQGRMARSLGAFVCETAAGDTFTVAPSVDEARRRELWHGARHIIGAALTVQYQELSSQGIPRFPVGKAIRGASMSSATWL